MATPTNLPANVAVGDLVTSNFMNNVLGSFRILRVVYATTTTAVGSTSATPSDTGLSASITPQSSANKILVFASHSTYTFGAGTTGGMYLNRNSTVLQTFLDVGYQSVGSNSLTSWMTLCLDSPATTSSVTYKTQQFRGLGSGTFYTQVNSNPGTLVLCEVSA